MHPSAKTFSARALAFRQGEIRSVSAARAVRVENNSLLSVALRFAVHIYVATLFTLFFLLIRRCRRYIPSRFRITLCRSSSNNSYRVSASKHSFKLCFTILYSVLEVAPTRLLKIASQSNAKIRRQKEWTLSNPPFSRCSWHQFNVCFQLWRAATSVMVAVHKDATSLVKALAD